MAASPDHATHYSIEPWEADLARVDGWVTLGGRAHRRASPGRRRPRSERRSGSGGHAVERRAARSGADRRDGRRRATGSTHRHPPAEAPSVRARADDRLGRRGGVRLARYRGGLRYAFTPVGFALLAIMALGGLASVRRDGRVPSLRSRTPAAAGGGRDLDRAGVRLHVLPRAGARAGADPVRPAGPVRGLLHLLRVSGLLRRSNRRHDAGQGQADPNSPSLGPSPSSCWRAARRSIAVLAPSAAVRAVAVPVRVRELLRDPREPDPAAPARRVLDPVGLHRGPRPAASFDRVHPARFCGARSSGGSVSASRRSGWPCTASSGVAFTVFAFATGIFFWEQIFGGLITSLWSGGLFSRLLLILLILLFLGPVIRGAISLGARDHEADPGSVAPHPVPVRALLAGRGGGADRRASGLRRSAADVLSDLAGRVRLRTYPPGRAVFRQGDRPDSLLRGPARAGERRGRGSDTGETRTLRTLERGASFGEIGLLETAMRRATRSRSDEHGTVRGDKSAFERLLADSIDAPTFAPTMQAYRGASRAHSVPHGVDRRLECSARARIVAELSAGRQRS